MARRRKMSREERESRQKYSDLTRGWRTHPDDVWAELEHLDLTAKITALGWSQPRVSRAMNSVASPQAFRQKVERALREDAPLYLASGVGSPNTVESEHGYTRDPVKNLDPEAEVIDGGTLHRLHEETADRQGNRLEDLILAAEQVREALDARVRANPDFMRLAGRHIWLIRSKIDALTRDLRRRAA